MRILTSGQYSYLCDKCKLKILPSFKYVRVMTRTYCLKCGLNILNNYKRGLNKQIKSYNGDIKICEENLFEVAKLKMLR